MKKIILCAIVALFVSSCGLFPRYSYMVRGIEKQSGYFYYNDDIRYKVGDTITVDGFKAKIIDARY